MKPVRKSGFTIIELLVVITIIGLLIGAAGIGLAKARVNNRDSRRISDVLQLAHAIDQSALSVRGMYPTNTGGSSAVIVNSSSSLASQLDLSLFTSRQIPSDAQPEYSSCLASPVNYTCGYVYSNRQATSLAKPANGQQYEYVLEIGLEGSPTTDLQGITNTPSSSDSARTRYLYFGKPCGGSLAANTCSVK